MTTRKPEADSIDQKKKDRAVRAPSCLSDVIDETAVKNFQTRSEYICSLIERLKADGVVFESSSTARA
jgi:hypothetical protein